MADVLRQVTDRRVPRQVAVLRVRHDVLGDPSVVRRLARRLPRVRDQVEEPARESVEAGRQPKLVLSAS